MASRSKAYKNDMHNGVHVYAWGFPVCRCKECKVKRASLHQTFETNRIERKASVARAKTCKSEETAIRLANRPIITAPHGKPSPPSPPPCIKTPEPVMIPRCPCGKLAYPTHDMANAIAFTGAATGYTANQMRVYQCPKSGRWHLTRKV